MHGKSAAGLWVLVHSVADTVEEKLLLKYNEIQYLFWVNVMAGIVTLFFSIFGHIELSVISFFVLIVYSLAMIGGDFCYTKAIKTLPIGLANLIDSGSLFLILLGDIALGYIKPRLSFLVLFAIFFVSIYIFSYETNKMKNEIKNKKIDLKNIFILITSTIFYASEPYFLKLATSKGANELGINLVSYLITILVFYFLYRKEKSNIKNFQGKAKRNFYIPVFFLGSLYAVTGILNSLAYASGTPVIINLIMKLQVFLVVIISVICRTDKMNWKKLISLIVGMAMILIMTVIS